MEPTYGEVDMAKRAGQVGQSGCKLGRVGSG